MPVYRVRPIYTGRGAIKTDYPRDRIVVAKTKAAAVRKVRRKLRKNFAVWSAWRIKIKR